MTPASGILYILRIFLSVCVLGRVKELMFEARIRLSILYVLRAYVRSDSPLLIKVRVTTYKPDSLTVNCR